MFGTRRTIAFVLLSVAVVAMSPVESILNGVMADPPVGKEVGIAHDPFVALCNDSTFSNLLSRVKLEIANLQHMITAAEAKGVDCSYEWISVRVGNLFVTYAQLDHAGRLSQESDPLRRGHAKASKGGGRHTDANHGGQTQRSSNLSCVELSRTLDVANNASRELQTLLGDRTLHRLRVPAHNMLGVVEKDGYFFRPETGRPVFPGGFDQGIWKYLYGFIDDGVTKQAISVGHDSDELAISIATVLPVNETYVNETLLALLRARLDYFADLGLSSSIYTGCELPDWALDKYPDLQLFMAAGCKQNIDVPELWPLWNTTLTAVYSRLHDHRALHSFRLANEIWFGIYGNKTIIPQVTLERWHEWINSTYVGDIEHLNSLYGEHYQSFQQVPVPGVFKDGILHPNPGTAPVAIGRDLALFLEYRSTAHFSNMIAALKAVNASVKTHIKFVNNNMFSSWAYGGVDRMLLNDLTTWVGCDTRIMPYPVQQIHTTYSDHLQYALDWLPAAMGYTFMRTSSHGKPVIDQEIHPISTSRNRNASIAFGHVTAAMFIAHLHGLSMHLIWEWSRAEDGAPSDNLLATLLTMPQTLDDYSRTMAYINAVAPEVHALATAPRPLCIFLSNTAKQNGEKGFFDAFVDTFEATAFYGSPVSIVTDFMLDRNSTSLQHCEVLLLPKTTYCTGAVLKTIRDFNRPGNRTVVIDHENLATGELCAYHENGLKRNRSELAWTWNLTKIGDSTPKSLLQYLLPHLSSASRVVRCIESGASNAGASYHTSEVPPWGILCRSVMSRVNTSTSALVALINTLNSPTGTMLSVDAAVLGGHLDATDLYLNRSIDILKPLLLRPLQVMILRITRTS